MPSFAPYGGLDPRAEEERRRQEQLLALGPPSVPAPEPLPYEQPPAPEPTAAPAPAQAAAAPAPEPAFEPEPEAEPELETDPVASMPPFLARAFSGSDPRPAPPELPPPPTAYGTPPGALIGAAALDLFLNKGRNAGRFIAELAAGDQAAEYENWKRQTEHAKSQQQLAQAYGGRRGGPSTEQLGMQWLRYQQGERRLADREEQTRQSAERAAESMRRWNALNTVGSPEHAAMLDWAAANGIPRAQIAGLPIREITKSWPAINEYLKSTGEIGSARTGQAARTARAEGFATVDPKAAAAGAVAAAQQPYELEKIDRGAKAKIGAEREAYGTTEVGGLKVQNPNVWGSFMSDPGNRLRAYDSAGAYRSMLNAMDNMEALRAKYGAQLPGEVQGEYDRNKGTVVSALTTLSNTGVLNQGEWDRYSESVPDISWSFVDVPGAAAKVLQLGDGWDIKQNQLAGVRKALEANVNDRLYSWGVAYDYDSLPSRARRKPAGKPGGKPRAAAPAASAQPATLQPIDVSGSGWRDK